MMNCKFLGEKKSAHSFAEGQCYIDVTLTFRKGMGACNQMLRDGRLLFLGRYGKQKVRGSVS